MKYSICYAGGLGDVFVSMRMQDSYISLDNLKPEDTCDIHIVSPNPFCHEIWNWHPKKDQLHVVSYLWRELSKAEQARTFNGIALNDTIPSVAERKKEVFYISDQDKVVLDELGSTSFVAISASAGGEYRNLPRPILESICAHLIEKGIKVVGVGRTFQRYGPNIASKEIGYEFNPGVLSLIDKLSVPGTVELFNRAAGVVVCTSSMSIANWYFSKKPNLTFYPDDYDIAHAGDQYSIGLNYPESIVLFNREFTLDKVDELIKKIS